MIGCYANSAITITPKGTLGGDGKYDFDGSAVTTKAFVIYQTGLIKQVTGEEIVYNKIAFLKPGVTIVIGDKITHDSTAHEVIKIEKKVGFGDNALGFKVWLQ